MVAAAQVDLAEVLGALQPIEQLVHTRQRVLVLDGDVVQRAVVDAHAHGAILLLDEQDRRTERRLGRLDEAGLDQFLELLLQLGQLPGRHTERGPTRGLRAGHQLDLVVDLSRGGRPGWKLVGEDVPVLVHDGHSETIESRGLCGRG